MTDERGLRERKKVERRRCIEAAAIDLFETNGFDRTTIEDIADKADISPRTFFSYFPTKEDVVLADYTTRLDRIVDELRRQPAATLPWAALEAAFVVVAGDYSSQRDELVRRFTIMVNNPAVAARSLQLQAGWEEAVAEVLNERVGTSDDELSAQLMSSAALACMRSSLRHWLLTGYQTDLPTLVARSFRQLANGLG